MTIRRAWWRIAEPFVLLAHRAGWCSYTWVNVCLGARRADLFTALWQHEWYGTPVTALPDEVVLCGIGYTTAASARSVAFRSHDIAARIAFYRDDHWRVEIAGRVPAAHVDEAYRWVRAVFGSHERRRAAA